MQDKIHLHEFNVIGITVRTSNVNNQGIADIGALWHKFMSEQILAKIPNKVDNNIYSIYTEYAGDYMQPYTTLIGCKVAHLEEIPSGMRGMKFASGVYRKFSASSNMTADNSVGKVWYNIWQSDLDRAYTQDFDIYDTQAPDPSNAAVDIYVAVK